MPPHRCHISATWHISAHVLYPLMRHHTLDPARPSPLMPRLPTHNTLFPTHTHSHTLIHTPTPPFNPIHRRLHTQPLLDSSRSRRRRRCLHGRRRHRPGGVQRVGRRPEDLLNLRRELAGVRVAVATLLPARLPRAAGVGGGAAFGPLEGSHVRDGKRLELPLDDSGGGEA